MNAPTPALVAPRPERLRLVGQRRQILAIMHQRLMFGMLVFAGIVAIIVLRILWLAAFGDHASPDQYGGLLVRYDAKNESTLLCDFTPERTTDSFSIDRPCGDDRLFVALHHLMSLRPSFLTYPDEELVCIVTKDAFAAAVREQHPELAEAVRVCQTPESLTKAW